MGLNESVYGEISTEKPVHLRLGLKAYSFVFFSVNSCLLAPPPFILTVDSPITANPVGFSTEI